MGLYNQTGGLRRITDRLAENIKNSSTAGAIQRSVIAFKRVVETIILSDDDSVLDIQPVENERYFAGDPEIARKTDIVAGRWFATEGPLVILIPRILEARGYLLSVRGRVLGARETIS